MTRRQQSIQCPKCGATSYHPLDIVYGYCGNCNEYTTPRPWPGAETPNCEHANRFIVEGEVRITTDGDKIRADGRHDMIVCEDCGLVTIERRMSDAEAAMLKYYHQEGDTDE